MIEFLPLYSMSFGLRLLITPLLSPRFAFLKIIYIIIYHKALRVRTNCEPMGKGLTIEGAIMNGHEWQHWQQTNTTQKTKKMSNSDPTRKQGMNTGDREGSVV
jgi:hypothetical protein